MVYSTDATRWRAYQFLDPFAKGSFFVCNKVKKFVCRPDCDAFPITELRLEIKFVDAVSQAVELGYTPCELCDPVLVPSINVDLLVRAVRDINSEIGFVPPLLDDDEQKITETIKENLMDHSAQRRQLVPVVSLGRQYEEPLTVSKNDSEHYRLVDLACRHLALAAAMTIFHSGSTTGSPKSDLGLPPGKGSKKRRGGVLGFKELAAKSKLSAWHFHRVFKSVTGLTPKTYGDKCWEYLEAEEDTAHAKPVSTTASTPAVDDKWHLLYLTPQESVFRAPVKRAAEDDDVPLPKRRAVAPPPATEALNDLIFDEELAPALDFVSRSTLAPDLRSYEGRPASLFDYRKAMVPEEQQVELDSAGSASITPSDSMAFMAADLPFQQDFMAVPMPEVNFAGPGFSADMFAASQDDFLQPYIDLNDLLMLGLAP